MRKMNMKVLGGMILALVLMAVAAQAAVVTVSCNPANVPPNPILNAASANLPSGYVQVIRSTDGSVSAPNASDGLPSSATDAVVSTGTLSAPGTFTKSGVSISTGQYVYIVAWDTWTGVGAPTGNYGISVISAAMAGVSYTYKPASFLVNIPIEGLTFAPTGAYRGDERAITVTNSSGTFTSGTTFDFGTGISVVSKSLVSATSYTVNIRVLTSAATGARTVTASTGGSGSFTVSAPSFVLAPTSGNPGSSPTITVTGTGTHFQNGVTTVSVSGSGVTAGTPTVTSTTALTVVLNIDAAAATGARTVTITTNLGTPGTETVTSTFTISSTPVPTLTSATPATGPQGQTLTTVAIVGSNTNFTAASTVDFGAGITVGSVTYTDATHVTANNVVISSTATTGSRIVTVTTAAETATGSIFTVTGTTTGDTTVVIDDYEGTAVAPTGYYVFGPTSAANPTATRVTGSANLHEGTYGMNTVYSAATDGWRGWGGVLSSTKNLSSTPNLVFWLKGDGTTNKVKVQFKDADGTNFALGDADAVSTNSAVWHECTISDFKTKMTRVSGSTTGDSTMDWANITEYQLVFVGSGASTGVLVDYVVATGTTSTTPTIVSISPALGPAGTAVTIAGSNFGTAGDIRFARSGTGTYSIRSTDSNVTSYTSGQIVFTTPALSTGIWNVTVYVTPAESNSVTFEVTAGAPGATDPYNYPNPFNPYRSEITTIVFYPGTSTNATIYLFDSTAKVVQKISWTGTANAAGQASVTWDGKNAYGEIVGDGVYLYRVVDGSKALGKGKILAVNK